MQLVGLAPVVFFKLLICQAGTVVSLPAADKQVPVKGLYALVRPNLFFIDLLLFYGGIVSDRCGYLAQVFRYGKGTGRAALAMTGIGAMPATGTGVA